MRAPKRPHTSAEIRQQIADFKRRNPFLANSRIAARFDVHNNTVTAALRENGLMVREYQHAERNAI